LRAVFAREDAGRRSESKWAFPSVTFCHLFCLFRTTRQSNFLRKGAQLVTCRAFLTFCPFSDLFSLAKACSSVSKSNKVLCFFTDVLSFQVGAGVSGLCAALTLLQNGLSVRVIDKEPTPKVGCKGMGVHVCFTYFPRHHTKQTSIF
jgi:hypothetical protein